MKKEKQFKLLIEEAENGVLLHETEALPLETEVDAGAGTKAEVEV
jgi:hypothetical protein